MSDPPEIAAAKAMAAALKLAVIYSEESEVCISIQRGLALTIGRADGFTTTADGWTVQVEFRVRDGEMRATGDALAPQLALALSNVAAALLGSATE